MGIREGLQDYSLLPEVSLHGIDETEGQILIQTFHLHELFGSHSVKGFGVGISRGGQALREGGIRGSFAQGYRAAPRSAPSDFEQRRRRRQRTCRL